MWNRLARPGQAVTLPTMVFPENHFLTALRRELKRSLRLNGHLLVMFLDCSRCADSKEANPAILDAATSAFRETDLKGWYRQDRVLGVIFTEYGDTDLNSLMAILRSRIHSTLERRLGSAVLSGITISFNSMSSRGDAAEIEEVLSGLYPEHREQGRSGNDVQVIDLVDVRQAT